jgi:hypothetical protein
MFLLSSTSSPSFFSFSFVILDEMR